MGSTCKGSRWRARRGLLVAARSGGLVEPCVAGGSVRDGELFLDRFPGRADACVGCYHTKGKLDLCYGSTGRSDRNGFLRVEVATRRWSRRSRAKSFGADLGGNKSNHSKFEATESIANEVKLKA